MAIPEPRASVRYHKPFRPVSCRIGWRLRHRVTANDYYPIQLLGAIALESISDKVNFSHKFGTPDILRVT